MLSITICRLRSLAFGVCCDDHRCDGAEWQPRICAMWLGPACNHYGCNQCVPMCTCGVNFHIYIYTFHSVHGLVHSDKWRRNNNDEDIYKLFLYPKPDFVYISRHSV